MSSSEAGPLTVFSQDILDETWEKLLAHSYDSFKAEGNLNLFLEELNREDQWYSTKNLLLRYGKEHFEGCESENELAEAMFQATKKALAGTKFPLIKKVYYENYLSGKIKTITRVILHRMALVFHFSLDLLFSFFAYGRGEPPFLWHDATECIYYYVLTKKNGNLAIEADGLIRQYNDEQASRSEASKAIPTQEASQPSTQFFRAKLDGIKDDADLINYLLSEKTFLDKDNVSETARQAVKELYGQAEMQYKQVIRHNWHLRFALKSLRVAKDEPEKDDWDVDLKEHPIKDTPGTAIRADLLPVYLNTKHFQDVIDGEKKATKQDVVFLRFYNTVLADFKENGGRPDSTSQTGFFWQNANSPRFTVFREDRSHKDFVWNWLLETNEILVKCGLPEMYLASRFDATVLSALTSDNPEAFFADVMWHFVEDIDEVDDEDM